MIESEEKQAAVTSAVGAAFRILFVTTNHLPYVGGAEVSTHHLATALIERGHVVSVLTGLSRRSINGLVDLVLSAVGGARQAAHRDVQLGYPTVRSIRPLQVLAPYLEEFRPDVVVVTGSDPGFANPILARSSSYPSILYMRIAPSASLIADGLHADLLVGNSEAVADLARGLGHEAVFLPSLFPPEFYKVPTTKEKVLFVNPVPKKGLDIALHLARSRPDIPFVFSLSWRMRTSQLRSLRRTARRLGNIEVRKATSAPSVLYRDCRLLLVPSQWTEAWCRVVSEAQINGIPAVASNVGGLPQSVGPGGLLIEPRDSKDAWLEALSSVWDHPQRYQELAERALEHSQRMELAVPVVVGRFESLLAQAVERHRRCPVVPSRGWTLSRP